MTIYIDDMNWPFGRMIMNHMTSDLLDPEAARKELDEMADKIGVARKWIQHPGTPDEHYDVALAAKRRAVTFGAVECDTDKTIEIIRSKRPKVKSGLSNGK